MPKKTVFKMFAFVDDIILNVTFFSYDVSNPMRGDYFCPHCWTLKDPVESGATLIVSPSAISYQWIEEIQKHIKDKNVRMLFYKGTKASGYIQPRALANYDIVVTTYQVRKFCTLKEFIYYHHLKN